MKSPSFSIKSIAAAAFFFVLLASCSVTYASHMVGGHMSYQLVSTAGGYNNYKVTLTLYIDCINGTPEAIAQDNPAFFSVFKNTSSYPFQTWDTTIYSDSGTLIPASDINPCYIGGIDYCLIAKKFSANFNLPVSTTGYVVSWQRCCMAANIVNVNDPSDNGQTISCIIPPSANTSAVFTHYPQRIACLNSPLTVDLSATDADGDSLSYEFTKPLLGASTSNVKPEPTAPPYDSVVYSYPYTTANPMNISSGMALDPVTGMLTCTPDVIGTYLVAINCIEWRGGAVVNKTNHNFEIIVTSCTHELPISAGDDTAIVAGTYVTFSATGGGTYHWLNTTNMSDSTSATPTVYFPSTGVYYYPVSITTPAGCTGVDTEIVTVISESEEMMPNAFTPNNDGKNDIFKPENIGRNQVEYIKVFNILGKMVYNGIEGWDGKYSGKEMEQGTYSWEMQYVTSAGQTVKKHGNVTLIR